MKSWSSADSRKSPMSVRARRRAGRIADLHRETLRQQEVGEPAAHLAGAADDERTLAAAGAVRGDAGLLLGGERGADQHPHQRLGDLWRDAALARGLAGAEDHLAFTAVVAGGMAGGALDARDLAAFLLALGDQFDQLGVDFVEALAQFVEGGHRGRLRRVGEAGRFRRPFL
jgi:hypothetical protein